MAKNDRKHRKQLGNIQSGGRIEGASRGPFAPGGRGGRVQKWKEIRWTPKRVFLTSLVLGVPYLVAVVWTWTAGLTVITYILMGLAMLVGFLCLLIGWIEKSEF